VKIAALFDDDTRRTFLESIYYGPSGHPVTVLGIDGSDFTLTLAAAAAAVPEPSSLVLGGLAAAAGLGLWAWRRRAARRAG
jgi:hypothetical protein